MDAQEPDEIPKTRAEWACWRTRLGTPVICSRHVPEEPGPVSAAQCKPAEGLSRKREAGREKKEGFAGPVHVLLPVAP